MLNHFGPILMFAGKAGAFHETIILLSASLSGVLEEPLERHTRGVKPLSPMNKYQIPASHKRTSLLHKSVS
jgi:hypothetical protein